MKVLHLLNHAGQGGSEQYIRTLIAAMEQNGVEAELAYHEYGPLAPVSYTHLTLPTMAVV